MAAFTNDFTIRDFFVIFIFLIKDLANIWVSLFLGYTFFVNE